MLVLQGFCGAPASQKRPEVGIGRDKNSPLGGRSIEDHGILRGLQAVLANMNGVVASRRQLRRKQRGQGVVDQELQPAAASGNSRSRTASAA
jgi:hypothetical protein